MTSQTHEIVVGELKHLYTLRNEGLIIQFLDANPPLYVFLREVPPVLRRYFPNENLALELMFYPDEPGSENLFIYIETPQELNKAMDILNQLTTDYWLELPREILRKLFVDVDLI